MVSWTFYNNPVVVFKFVCLSSRLFGVKLKPCVWGGVACSQTEGQQVGVSRKIESEVWDLISRLWFPTYN